MTPVRYLSVCSGIEAASVAWEPLGWEPAAFAEVEPFPCAVLKHHYPDVPNIGDMTRIHGDIFRGQIDVFVGGTPCQSFSVAGMRRGLEDDRGNLALEYVRIANASGPAFVVWENVPGILSDRGNAFGCFLSALAGEGAPLEPPGGMWTDAGYVLGPCRTIAWRVLDAQYFGLAQRRRRVFVAGCPAGGADPREILFEFDGLRRDSPPGREARQNIASSSGASVAQTTDLNQCLPIHDKTTRCRGGDSTRAGNGLGIGKPTDPCLTLDTISRHSIMTAGGIAGTLCGSGAGLHRPAGMGSEADFCIIQTLAGSLGNSGPDDNRAQGGFYVPDIVSQAVSCKWGKGSSGPAGDEHHNLVSCAVAQNQTGEVRVNEIAGTLNQNSNASDRKAPLSHVNAAVRRLRLRSVNASRAFLTATRLYPGAALRLYNARTGLATRLWATAWLFRLCAGLVRG